MYLGIRTLALFFLVTQLVRLHLGLFFAKMVSKVTSFTSYMVKSLQHSQ
ncbi:Uncharacterised protein [Salmonella enterica subsp. enterica serovar Typhi]|nr:Uncharacterised protein [Salmonella enterica subsp. enterica serovar Typhi]CRJ11863.1 Uncharacterised protein [Salmonella enterica subsp. enterica serovar Typhi]